VDATAEADVGVVVCITVGVEVGLRLVEVGVRLGEEVGLWLEDAVGDFVGTT
jgi:hypothetical protein